METPTCYCCKKPMEEFDARRDEYYCDTEGCQRKDQVDKVFGIELKKNYFGLGNPFTDGDKNPLI